ncbi:hypothetical protein QBC35DRAFT_487311 [Podospora australis]|uniref:Uncharacterized protein n=1 Tax=Podospora australis TaxID=1536484 RepID=A0AAN6X0A1_9PEZI|nr:hypothetical protein QBC35DRAFT_487311 [Podospora australis]
MMSQKCDCSLPHGSGVTRRGLFLVRGGLQTLVHMLCLQLAFGKLAGQPKTLGFEGSPLSTWSVCFGTFCGGHLGGFQNSSGDDKPYRVKL